MILGNFAKQCFWLLLGLGLSFWPAAAQEVAETPEALRDEVGFVEGVFQIVQDLLKSDEQEAPLLQEGPPPLLNPEYIPLGTFVVNLQGGKFFLKATITLVFAESSPKVWLEQRLPVVKDMLITQLGRLSAKKLRDARFRQRLRSELRVKINSLFPNNPPWDDSKPVKKILFEEFYTQ